MSKILTTIRKEQLAASEAAGTRRGYYLVKGDTRHFVSENVNEISLNRVADRVLSDAKGWDYWVDYSYGKDVHGNPSWCNVDCTDKFI
jgi:hypothetical protein